MRKTLIGLAVFVITTLSFVGNKTTSAAPAKKTINPGCYGACFGAYVLCRDNCHVMACQDFCYLQLQLCLDNCVAQ